MSLAPSSNAGLLSPPTKRSNRSKPSSAGVWAVPCWIGRLPTGCRFGKTGDEGSGVEQYDFTQIILAARKIGGSYGGIVEVLALTGQRREEVARCTWDEIDVKENANLEAFF